MYSRYDFENNIVTNIWINPFPDPQRMLHPNGQNSDQPAICRYFAVHAVVMPHCLSNLTSDGHRLRNEVMQEV